MSEDSKDSKRRVFKLLVGGHGDENYSYDARGQNIVVTEGRDLVKLFGRDKFVELPPDTPDPNYRKYGEEDLEGVEDLDEEEVQTTFKPLEKMNLNELKAFADEKEIDLGPAETKREIYGVIKEALMG